MKQLVAILAVATLIFLGLRSARADAVPACLPSNERLLLSITSASLNGDPGVAQTDGSAIYTTDAGVRFYVGFVSNLEALDAGSIACPAPADELKLVVTDPWTGEQKTLQVRGTP